MVVLQLAVIYTPGLSTFFGVRALGLLDLALTAAVGLVVFGVLEATRAFR